MAGRIAGFMRVSKRACVDLCLNRFADAHSKSKLAVRALVARAPIN